MRTFRPMENKSVNHLKCFVNLLSNPAQSQAKGVDRALHPLHQIDAHQPADPLLPVGLREAHVHLVILI